MEAEKIKYELKIEGGKEPKGEIAFKRLEIIADGIRKIAEGALLVRLRGISTTKGRKSFSLENCLDINLVGIRPSSTALDLVAHPFSMTMEPYQLDIFRSDSMIDIQYQTPVSLFMQSVNSVISNDADSKYVDKSLLKTIKDFNRAFFSDTETFVFSNQNSIDSLKINKNVIRKVAVLEDVVPEPEAIIVNGLVEELKYTKFKIIIVTAEGRIECYLSDNIKSEQVAQFWGKSVTIFGHKHYRANNTFIIEVQKIFSPESGDDYFSKKHISRDAEKQIEHQLSRKGNRNELRSIINQWPSDEDIDDLLGMLKK